MRRRPIVITAILTAAVTAGCGGSGGGSNGGAKAHRTSTSRRPSDATTSSAAPTTTTAARPTASADHALAQSAVLTIADLPAGWKAEPHPTTDARALEQDLVTCAQVPISAIDTDLAPHADSDFSQPSTETTFVPTLEGGVAVYPSKSQASAVVDAAIKPIFPSCVATATANELRRQGVVNGVSTSAHFLSIAPIGDRSVAIQALLVAGPVTTHLDLLFAQRGRAIAYIAGGSGLGSADPELEAAMLAKLVTRLGAAAA